LIFSRRSHENSLARGSDNDITCVSNVAWLDLARIPLGERTLWFIVLVFGVLDSHRDRVTLQISGMLHRLSIPRDSMCDTWTCPCRFINFPLNFNRDLPSRYSAPYIIYINKKHLFYLMRAGKASARNKLVRSIIRTQEISFEILGYREIRICDRFGSASICTISRAV